MIKKVYLLLYIFICTGLLVGCKQEKEENSDTLTIGIIEESPYMDEYLENFKHSHPNCEVVIKDYRKYEDGVTMQDIVQDMMLDVVSGNGPDVVSWGYSYAPEYVVDNAFMDLSSFVNDNLDEDTYFTNIIKSFAINEKIYVLMPNFKIETMVTDKKWVDGSKEWTTSKVMELYESNKEEYRLDKYDNTQFYVFIYFFRGEYNRYVDWESGNCSFTGTEFIDLLEFCNQFRDANIDETTEVKPYIQTLFIATDVFSVTRIRNQCGDMNLAYYGYPTSDGGKNVACIANTAFSIAENCENTDMAYEFLKGWYDEEYQSELMNEKEDFCLPISKNALYEKLDWATNIEYKENDTGELEPVVKYEIKRDFYDTNPILIYSIGSDERDILLEIIDSVNSGLMVDYPIYNIVLEEVEAYFAEDKSASEVANIIDSRAQLYMNEKY